jgi:molybdate transport system permease protein
MGLGTALLVLVGIPLGAWLGRSNSRLSRAIDFIVGLPLVFPPIATGFLLLLFLGRRGPVGSWLDEVWGVHIIFSFSALVIAVLITGLPLMVKPVQAAFRNETRRLSELAQVLGKNPWEIFLRVILPNIRRSVLTGLFLAVLRGLGEVGVTLMLGGNIVGRTNTISLEVYNAVFTGEYARAWVLTGLLAVLSLAALLLLRRLAPGESPAENYQPVGPA